MFQGARHPLNQLDEYGFTKLYYAVNEGKHQEVEMLLEHGASVDASCGPLIQTALHEAATKGDAEMVKLLLKSGASQGCLSGDGKRAEDLCPVGSFIPALFSKYHHLNRNCKFVMINQLIKMEIC